MNVLTAHTNSQQISNQLSFIESFLSWPRLTEASEMQEFPVRSTQNGSPSQDFELTLGSMQPNLRSVETEAVQKHQPQAISQQIHQSLCPNSEMFSEWSNTEKRDQIKTFPNFIFRTFCSYFSNYQHLYSEKDGLSKLKKYLSARSGAKHYTLAHLSMLFQDCSLWNAKLNRAVLHRMLGRHSYASIFGNAQRKKKKVYLVMTKVFKLRCRGSLLCTRVQSD